MKSIFESIDETYKSYRSAGRLKNIDSALQESVGFSKVAATYRGDSDNENQLAVVSNELGKKGIHVGRFGNHPEFEHLSGTKQYQNGFVGTLFIDIEGSSKLSLFYDLEDVCEIKNAIIKTAIAIIQAIDGHVHRIMGDAVMAYFRSDGKDKYTSAIDLINAATIIKHFFITKVLPDLNRDGFNDDFGIRIGLDWADDSNVIWSAYGYGVMEEITATSFFVDVASKLQHSAGKNNIQIGQSLKEFIDLPDDLISIKQLVKDGEKIDEPHLIPNYMQKDKKPLNYKKWIFDSEKYMRMIPILSFADSFIKVELSNSENETVICEYRPCSKAVSKGLWLKFTVTTFSFNAQGYTDVDFIVENHGKEASRVEKNGNHNKEYKIKQDTHQIVHWEHTEYRGFHYMKIQIKGFEKETKNKVIGVYIN